MPIFSASTTIRPSRLRLAAALLLPLVSAACMSVSPRAMYELARFDPFTADPRGIAVAVMTDRTLHLRDGDVVMRVALQDPDPAKAFDETFQLALSEGAPDPKLAAEAKPSDHVIGARFADADISRYAAVQDKARAARAAGSGKGKGTLSVALSGGCRTAPLKGRAIAVRTYMRTEADGDFFPLTGAMNLKDMLGDAPLDDIPPCTSGR